MMSAAWPLFIRLRNSPRARDTAASCHLLTFAETANVLPGREPYSITALARARPIGRAHQKKTPRPLFQFQMRIEKRKGVLFRLGRDTFVVFIDDRFAIKSGLAKRCCPGFGGVPIVGRVVHPVLDGSPASLQPIQQGYTVPAAGASLCPDLPFQRAAAR